jgi:hypothetical protein
MEYTMQTKQVNRTRLLRRSNRIAGATQYGVDHLSLKKIGQKIEGGAKKLVRAVAPKFGAKLDAAKAKAAEDGKVTFGEKLGIGFKTATVPMLGIAAGVTGLGLVANAINKAEAKKELDMDVASATAKIPNVENNTPIQQITPGVAVTPSGNTNQPELVYKEPIVTTNTNTSPTNSRWAEKVLDLANKIPVGVKRDIKQVFTGTGSNDPAMLPKTKGLKDAEQVVNGGGALLSSTPANLFGGNPLVMAGIAAAVLLVLIIALKSKG